MPSLEPAPQPAPTITVEAPPKRVVVLEPAPMKMPPAPVSTGPAAPATRETVTEIVVTEAADPPAPQIERQVENRPQPRGEAPPRQEAVQPPPSEPVVRRERHTRREEVRIVETAAAREPERIAGLPPKPMKPQAEESPTLKIGTIEVRVSPPPPPVRPATPVARAAPAKSATALGRGFTSPFGLRQG